MKTDQMFIDRKAELVANLNGLNPRTIEDITSQIYTRLRFMRKKEVSFEIAKSLIDEAHEANRRNNATV